MSVIPPLNLRSQPLQAFSLSAGFRNRPPRIGKVPGVNNLKAYGRWAFVEFGDVFDMEVDFKAKVEERFKQMVTSFAS